MIFVVGGKGLTGSAIVRILQKKKIEYEIIQKENKNQFHNKKCDVLIFANGGSRKYLANENPFLDFHASVSSLVEYVHLIDTKLLVLLSTIEVYDQPSSEETTSEGIIINPEKLQPYGYHKFLVENYVKRFCKNYLIFRLPALVGIGTKKNPIFDFIHENKKVMISPESRLNVINTRLIAECVAKIIDEGIKNEIFNLASINSLRLGDAKNIVNFDSEYADDANEFIQNYQISTKKIQKYVKLSTSEEAIKEYFESLSTS